MRLTTFVAAAAAFLIGTADAAARPTLLVKNVRIVQLDRDAPAMTRDLLISGDRIIRIGRSLAAKRTTRIINGRGRYAIPGLWDMHSHVAATNEVGSKPEDYVGHGVLAIRDMGGRLPDLLGLKKEIAHGRTGPVMVIAGPTLNGTQAAPFHRVIGNADEARVAVRELKAAGVDFIKVHRATSGEAFLAALAEAKRVGLEVSGHVPLAMKWNEAAAAGMHTIEHAQTIVENEVTDPRSREQIRSAIGRLEGPYGDRLFTELAHRGVYFDPTLAYYEESIRNVDPRLGAERRLLLDHLKKLVLRAHTKGVPLLVGTDAVEAPGKFVAREIEMLVSSGISPREALRAATITAAQAAGRPQLGRLAVGSPASFVLLDKDPIREVETMRTPSAVMLRSEWLDSVKLEGLRSAATGG